MSPTLAPKWMLYAVTQAGVGPLDATNGKHYANFSNYERALVKMIPFQGFVIADPIPNTLEDLNSRGYTIGGTQNNGLEVLHWTDELGGSTASPIPAQTAAAAGAGLVLSADFAAHGRRLMFRPTGVAVATEALAILISGFGLNATL